MIYFGVNVGKVVILGWYQEVVNIIIFYSSIFVICVFMIYSDGLVFLLDISVNDILLDVRIDIKVVIKMRDWKIFVVWIYVDCNFYVVFFSVFGGVKFFNKLCKWKWRGQVLQVCIRVFFLLVGCCQLIWVEN